MSRIDSPDVATRTWRLMCDQNLKECVHYAQLAIKDGMLFDDAQRMVAERHEQYVRRIGVILGVLS